MGKLKSPDITSGKKISVPIGTYITEYQHPIFCFRYLHNQHCLMQCDKDEKTSLIEKLVALSTMTWQEIQLAPRHGLGREKISRNSIKPSIPQGITDDVEFFLAFRFSGKKPFIGYRNKFVFI